MNDTTVFVLIGLILIGLIALIIVPIAVIELWNIIPKRKRKGGDIR